MAGNFFVKDIVVYSKNSRLILTTYKVQITVHQCMYVIHVYKLCPMTLEEPS